MSLLTKAVRKFRNDGFIPLVKSGFRYVIFDSELYRRWRATRGEPREEQHNHFKNEMSLQSYIDADTDRTSYWIESQFFQNSEKGTDSKILELGCNVGRHLNAFHKRGYSNISGVDINEDALEKMEELYPALSKDVNLYNEPFENFLPNVAESYDLVYSVAVLMHVSDDSEFIFDEITRVCDGILVTIEAEEYKTGTTAHRIVYRDYGDIFESRGFNEILSIEFEDAPEFFGDNLDDRYVARIFEKQTE